jgi:hypothetical protein
VKVVGGSEIYNFPIDHIVHFSSKFWSYARPNRGTVKLFQSVDAAPRCRAPARYARSVPSARAPTRSLLRPCAPRPRPEGSRDARRHGVPATVAPEPGLPAQLDATAYNGSAAQCLRVEPSAIRPPPDLPAAPEPHVGAFRVSRGELQFQADHEPKRTFLHLP